MQAIEQGTNIARMGLYALEVAGNKYQVVTDHTNAEWFGAKLIGDVPADYKTTSSVRVMLKEPEELPPGWLQISYVIHALTENETQAIAHCFKNRDYHVTVRKPIEAKVQEVANEPKPE